MNYAQIGQKIRLAREEAGLSQEEVGNRLGCSGVTISTWEMGKRRISLEDLHRLAKVLGKPLAFFFPDGSLSVNMEQQIGALLRRSIGDLIGTKQIPIYSVSPDNSDPLVHPIKLAWHTSVATNLPVDFGLIIPDDRLAGIGIGAGDIATCRHCDGQPPQEDCLMLHVDGDSLRYRFCAAGEHVVCPAKVGIPPAGQPDSMKAICGILVFNVRKASDILAAFKSVQRREALEA